MKKKSIFLIVIFIFSSMSLFARNPFSISLGGLINYNYIDKMDLGIQLDIKKDYFNFDFDIQTDLAFENLSSSVFFGANPYWTKNFSLSTLVGANANISYKPFANKIAISPLFRIQASYVFDFGLELKPFFDIGYKFNVKNNNNSGLNFKFGIMIGYCFDLGKPNNKIKTHPELDDAYTTILPSTYKTEEKEKSIQSIIDDLEKEKEFYKDLALKESIRYVAVDKDTLFQTDRKPEDVIKTNIENSRESIKNSANFIGSTSIYIYDENKIFDIFLNPKNITDIRLEDGESLVENGVVLGDRNAWICDLISSSEKGKNYLHILFRPQNTGISTDCMIFTDRRVYKLRLISDSNNFSQVSVYFKYQEENKPSNYFGINTSNNSNLSNNSKVYVSTENLNFNYSINGDESIKPERVYSDTNKTYIQFKNSFLKSPLTPTLLMKNRINEETEIIPFIVKGITYIVPFVLDESYSFILKLEDKEVEIKRSY